VQLSERLETGDDLALTFAAGGEYAAKQPDEDIEAKLAQIDPVHDRVLAFVGRLISAKGPHALMAALPFAFREDPRLRVLVIGHGPLREPLEAMVVALARGDRSACERVLAHMQGLEAPGPQYSEAVRHYHDRLAAEGRLDEYWQAARSHVHTDRVLFVGYLTHREMAWLLPSCDAVVVPSMVEEAGPLVFLEALASGAFPVGTSFGGMAAKLDVVEPLLDPEHGAAMRLRPAADHIVSDIADAVPEAVKLADRYRSVLRSVAEENYDWRPVARRLGEALDALGS
jgi:glycosyltransferase involved in cell wall biosynthesis